MKHKKVVISESGLFLVKTNRFTGASPDQLMTCYCCEDACAQMKCPFSEICEKSNEKSWGKLYKGKREIKLKTNYSYFMQCMFQIAVTNRKLFYLFVRTHHCKFIDTIYKFWWHHMKNIRKKLIAFCKDFYLRSFFKR